MGFMVNSKKAEAYELIPAGEYECIITNAGIRQTPNGAYKIALTLTIRNDVQQACANRLLFLDIWRKREPNDDDRNVDGFNYAQINSLAAAVRFPDGSNFESLEQFLQVLTGRVLRATVTHREYNGRIFENIDQLRGVHPSQFPECRHRAKNPASGSAPQNGYNQQQGNNYQQNNGYNNQQGGYPQNNGYNQQGNNYQQQGNNYRQNTGYQHGGNYPPPAQPPAYPTESFEEILSDGQVPF